MIGEGDDARDAAEQRLVVLLEVLRADAPRPDESISEGVMRTARWQYLVRGLLSVLSDLVALLADGVILMLGLRADPVRP